MSDMDVGTDVMELCAMLQCLGFAVKSLDAADGNASQDSGIKTIIINCQTSGLQVVMESASIPCSCPVADQQTSGFWQVSGVAGGRQHDQESGSTLLPSIPRVYREKFSNYLRDMVLCIKTLNDSEVEQLPATHKSASMLELTKDNSGHIEMQGVNRSASMLECATPETRNFQYKLDTLSRYRSLETLAKDDSNLRMLQKLPVSATDSFKNRSILRQATYTLASNGGGSAKRSTTSSPIRGPQNTLLENLLQAEATAESLRNCLAIVVRDFVDEYKHDSSISSLLDMSKISILKADTPKAQFASSPNLSGLGTLHKDLPKSGLRRESSSVSDLGSQPASDKDGKVWRRRIIPNIFKHKDGGGKTDKSQGGKTNLRSSFKPKTSVPVPKARLNSEASPIQGGSLSASKKKYSHVKSTIPKLTPKKQ